MRYRLVLRTDFPRWLRRLALILVGLVAGGGLLALVFAVSFFTAMRVEMRSTEVVVPDLTGLTMEASRERVEPLDLVLEVVDQRNDPRVASGRVLEQMPPAGASVRRGRKMKLVLSLGGRVLRVPDLIGHAARAVAIELRQEGLIPGDEAHVHSYDIPAGRVIAQVPPSSTSVVPNSRVYRLVSDGPPPATWVMPDLTGRTLREAEQWIELCGFRKGTVRRAAARGQRSGVVLSQMPQAGYPIRSRDIVEFVVTE